MARRARRSHRTATDELVARALRRGDATGWFDELYRAADGDTTAVPWQRGSLHPAVAAWVRDALDEEHEPGDLSPCLVVGCGLGDDAAALARLGFTVTAFDVAPTAVRWARQRHPDADVRWVQADLLEPPMAWRGTFRTVIEVRTLQSLPADVRPAAARNVNGFVAPGGVLVGAALAAATPDAAEAHEGPPWALPPGHLDVLFDGLDVRDRSDRRGDVDEIGFVAVRATHDP